MAITMLKMQLHGACQSTGRSGLPGLARSHEGHVAGAVVEARVMAGLREPEPAIDGLCEACTLAFLRRRAPGAVGPRPSRRARRRRRRTSTQRGAFTTGSASRANACAACASLSACSWRPASMRKVTAEPRGVVRPRPARRREQRARAGRLPHEGCRRQRGSAPRSGSFGSTLSRRASPRSAAAARWPGPHPVPPPTPARARPSVQSCLAEGDSGSMGSWYGGLAEDHGFP